MAVITIDGKKLEVPDNKNVLECALDAGIYIPHLCHHKDLNPLGSCRMCIVEVNGQDGVMASCTLEAKDGMVITTKSQKLDQLRRLLELLTAVDNTVADGVNLAHIVDALALAGGHLLHDLSKSLGVGGEDRGSGSLVAVGVMGDHAALHADALAQALAQHLLTVHIDELIFQGRRTTVDNQNFHLLVSSRYVFVRPREGRILQIPRIII